jgi:hypothetical protein
MLPPVPDGIEPARRRWPGMDFVDRTDVDDPIAWEVLARSVSRDLLRAAEEQTSTGAAFESLVGETPDEPVVTVEARSVSEACAIAREAAPVLLGLDPEEWAVVAVEARPVGATRFARDPSNVS